MGDLKLNRPELFEDEPRRIDDVFKRLIDNRSEPPYFPRFADNQSSFSSIHSNQASIIAAICSMHNDRRPIECDLCFNIGSMYEHLPLPVLKFDINPSSPGVLLGDFCNVNLNAASLRSVIADPPFLIGSSGPMIERYSGYKSLSELKEKFGHLISESYRILETDGLFVIKCQDIIHDRRRYFVSLYTLQSALRIGFNPIDELIFVAKSRITPGTQVQQQASRSFHSKFIVFRKRSGRRSYVI